jgi:hypothetical protein
MFQGLRGLSAVVADLAALRARVAGGDRELVQALRVVEGWRNLALARAYPAWPDPAVDLPGWAQALADSGLIDAPKLLIPFHDVSGRPAPALEAHLHEAIDLGTRGGVAQVHFTVPGAWKERCDAEIGRLAEQVGAVRGVRVAWATSVQDPTTDTPALHDDDRLVCGPDGSPILRPGGHGALLRNIPTDAAIVLIKNVDNVAHPDRRAALVGARRTLLTALRAFMEERREHTELVRAGRGVAAARRFLAGFGLLGPADATSVLVDLDRPLRVCGVVANDGQPGGGPFWVRGADGRVTLQIVESVEVGPDPAQAAIFSAATHFNPVDLACAVHDVEGAPYDLARFVDPRRWLRTTKEQGGRRVRCLEYPGLWNGGMSGWLTRFVEMPRATFNPVKVLADLLGDGHRALPHEPPLGDPGVLSRGRRP